MERCVCVCDFYKRERAGRERLERLAAIVVLCCRRLVPPTPLSFAPAVPVFCCGERGVRREYLLY
jgi:hypothetical protein